MWQMFTLIIHQMRLFSLDIVCNALKYVYRWDICPYLCAIEAAPPPSTKNLIHCLTIQLEMNDSISLLFPTKETKLNSTTTTSICRQFSYILNIFIILINGNLNTENEWTHIIANVIICSLNYTECQKLQKKTKYWIHASEWVFTNNIRISEWQPAMG